MKLFDDELDIEVKNHVPQYYDEYTKPLYELMRDSRDALCLLPIYPLDAIEEFLKYLVYYKDVSGVKARLFSEKYLTLGRGCSIYRLLELLGDEKYYQMIDELKILAEI